MSDESEGNLIWVVVKEIVVKGGGGYRKCEYQYIFSIYQRGPQHEKYLRMNRFAECYVEKAK